VHESFLKHRNFLWLKVAVPLCIGCVVAWFSEHPIDAPNGGTPLGYTLGTIGALLIVWLAWLGVRKRRYRSRLGTVRGWTSAHVYLGLALLVVVTLHTGFQFGANIHTFAYVLMLLVIASGVYGIAAYANLPARITDQRAQATRDGWLAEVVDLNEQAMKLADAIDPEVHRVVVRSIERLRIGGSLRDLLFGGGRHAEMAEVSRLGEFLRERLLTQGAQPPAFSATGQLTVSFMASQIVKGEGSVEIDRLQQLMGLLTRRNELADKLNADAQMHARMTVWLYLHVPLTAALLGALLAHIVSVFLYW
jgi:hypothetical protein